MQMTITTEMIFAAYAQGIFPMSDDKDSLVFDFYRPNLRAQLSIQDLHIPKKLFKLIHKNLYTVKIDTAFEQVIDYCAQSYKNRDSTWINKPIRDVFVELHHMGHAHSVEVWDNNNLIGGLYGLALGAVFCGESMFSKADNASKIALVHLCARLSAGGFSVLDTQFVNPHLEQFGIYEIPQEEYEMLIQSEMKKPADFTLETMSENQILTKYFSN